jgi:hypothetical protein
MHLLAYFRTSAEALHLALEEAPHTWHALRGNRPCLTGTVGSRTHRDPFLFRDRTGLYHLFTTDGWPSPSIVHATSPDLLAWSDQHLLPVMADIPGARNAWAPECFFDRAAGAYRIFWSSTVAPGPATKANNHRIWSVTTTDFQNYSRAELFFDPGYNVIDATIATLDDTDYMVFKDERGDNRIGTPHKRLRSALRPRGQAGFSTISDEFSPELVEGPILFRREGQWIVYFDHFMEGRWGAMTSGDFRHWQPLATPLVLPDGVRHGSILEIDPATAARLRAHDR